MGGALLVLNAEKDNKSTHSSYSVHVVTRSELHKVSKLCFIGLIVDVSVFVDSKRRANGPSATTVI